MSRTGWTTISIPDELYAQLAKHIPVRARSVQAYVAHWARIGSLIDDARTTDQGLEKFVERLTMAALETDDLADA